MSDTDNPLTDSLTLEGLGAALYVSTMTARRIVKAGEIPAFLWRGRYFIKREDLAAYLGRAVHVYRAARAAVPA